jgi:hypothetical protein
MRQICMNTLRIGPPLAAAPDKSLKEILERMEAKAVCSSRKDTLTPK